MVSTRPELRQQKGDEFNVNCPDCGTNTKKHVNDVTAYPSYTIALGGILLSFIVTAVLWGFVGLVGTITFLIPIIIYKQQSNSVHAFNSYLVRR